MAQAKNDEGLMYLIGTFIRTLIVTLFAMAGFLVIMGVAGQVNYDITVRQVMVAMSCAPLWLILGYELFDLFYAKDRIRNFYNTTLAGRIGKVVLIWAVILISVSVLCLMYLPSSPATWIVALIIGVYVMIPETSDDFVLIGIWCACAFPTLLYGWIPFDTWWQYQTMFLSEIMKAKPNIPILNGVI